MPSRRLRPIYSLLFALILALAALGAPAPQLALALPPTYIVDRTDDVFATACSGAANDCSLRGAVQNANSNPGSTISLNPTAVYVLTLGGSGELLLSANTTINGDDGSNGVCLVGACRAIIQGMPGWANRLLEVGAGVVVSVDHVEFTGGNSLSNGGALLNSGTLNLTASQVFSNTAAGWAGGILNFGTLTIANSIINGNKAVTTGGAIANQADVGLPGMVTIVDSSIITNSATGVTPGTGIGGGITSFNNISGTIHPVLSILDSSVLSNTGVYSAFGGGLYVDGSTTLTNVTLQGNSAGGGGGAYVHFGELTMQGGSVVSNTASNSSVSGGGFRNDGALTLNNVLVSQNQAGGGAGGGIFDNGAFTATNTTISGNNGYNGGGIMLGSLSAVMLLDHTNVVTNTGGYGSGILSYGTYTLTNGSIVSGNTGFQGGGLYLFSSGHALLTGNSQVRDNTTSGGAIGTSNGGAIFNQGQLQIQNATLSGNVATNGSGGGLYNDTGSQASLTSAAVVGNHAQAGPGGGVANRGLLTITASALVSNTTLASGGGISNTGTLSLLNTTLSGNSATSSGGGLFNNGQATLSFATLAANTGSVGGGLATTGTLTMSNTLLGDNTGAPFDCSGPVTSLGHNLVGHATGCTLSGPGTGDKLNRAPLITALFDQGGALRFHDLMNFSPALEAADPAGGACPATDQRGVARPIGPHCDIGAIESSALAYYYSYLPLIKK